jgi:DNA-binding GntR family transcriptional regulator
VNETTPNQPRAAASRAGDPTTGALGRGRLTDEAYHYVRDGIMRGEFRTGSVLAEVEIARTLGSSRTPVRHALGLLLKEGLLEIGSRRQLIVRGFTPEHRKEILMLREALEGMAVRRACEVMSDDDVDYLRLLIMRQRRAARNADNDAFLDLDEEFHLRIVEAARLPILHAVLGQLRGFVRVARLDASRPTSVLEQVSAEHERIVDALDRRDAEGALSALVEHLHTSDYAIAGMNRR